MSLMPVAEALEKLVQDVAPLEEQLVPLDQANGRYLAEALASTRTQPPFPASAMDGYAIRYEDSAGPHAKLRVIGEAPAGHGFSGHVKAGETVRIFTGAPVPDGADTILIQENAERSGDSIAVLETPEKGAFVRPAGLDFFKRGNPSLTTAEIELPPPRSCRGYEPCKCPRNPSAKSCHSGDGRRVGSPWHGTGLRPNHRLQSRRHCGPG